MYLGTLLRLEFSSVLAHLHCCPWPISPELEACSGESQVIIEEKQLVHISFIFFSYVIRFVHLLGVFM